MFQKDTSLCIAHTFPLRHKSNCEKETELQMSRTNRDLHALDTQQTATI